MKKKTRRTLALILFISFVSVAGAVALPKIKNRLFPTIKKNVSSQKINWSSPTGVLGALTSNENIPEVITLKLSKDGTESAAQNGNSLIGGALNDLSEQVQKAVKDAAGNIAESVKQSILDNVSINQEKIAQDITAKLLQSLLSSAGNTSKPVDRAVYDACTNIVKNTNSTDK